MGSIVLLGLAAGLGTCLGALIIIACGRLRPGAISLMLGLAAGIMMAVIFFDLLPASLRYGGIQATLAGMLGGIVLMAILDLSLSIFYTGQAGKDYLKMGYLIAAGIALHDLPEGLAIAAGFAAAEKLGPLLVLAIGLHNIPEGMACATPLRYGGMSAWRVLLMMSAISLVTPLGTFIGMVLVNISSLFISLMLSFAAGAMLYIVICELIPESRLHSRRMAYLGMLTGTLIILSLGLIA